MNAFQSLYRLIRFERAISAAAGVLITGVIVNDLTGFQWSYVLACLAVFFSAIANFVLNDVHDVEVDRVNNRTNRPVANGVISKQTALKIAIISSVLAYGLVYQLNPIPRFMIMIGLPITLAYNIYLKRYIVFKNLFTALANVGVILLGALILDSVVEPLAYYIALLGFFFSFSYEVMLDIADTKGDMAIGIDTIPVKYGKRKAALLSTLIGLGAVAANILPFFLNVDPRLFRDYLFLALILAPVANRIWISRALINDYSPENIMRLKGRLFRNLQLGGICYLIGFLI
jgi:4-hydroxybenzoate polyprenyltransferase